MTGLCPHLNECGGCDSQDKGYQDQLTQKQSLVKELLREFSVGTVEQIVPSPRLWHYRNKMEYIVGSDHDGQTLIGLRRKKRFQKIVDLKECRIFHPDVEKVFQTVKKWIKDFGIEPYNMFKHRGVVRYLALRHSKAFDKMMVTLVVALTREELNKEREKYNDLAERLKRIPGINSFYLCLNKNVSDVAVREDLELICGERSLKERINDIEYLINPTSFFQTNSYCCEKLYSVVRDAAEGLANENALDLYCGSGGITLQISKVFQKVIGIDISKQNIEDARNNAALNNIENINFVCADAEPFLAGLKDSGELAKYPTIMIDPPRSGLSNKTRVMILESGAENIIYVSCNPITLRDDLSTLVSNYRIMKVTPVDMFPHTRHLEVVTVLKKS